MPHSPAVPAAGAISGTSGTGDAGLGLGLGWGRGRGRGWGWGGAGAGGVLRGVGRGSAGMSYLETTMWAMGTPEEVHKRTRHPNAKDDLRAKARELRLQGLGYDDIVAQLHVSKSSVSLWVRDLPRPVSPEEARRRGTEAARRRWQERQPARDAQRAAEQAAAAAEIGKLTDRELLIAGAIAYWCEGAKSKPYRRQEQANFINSDPCVIGLYLRFLASVGVGQDHLRFRVHIHESADVAAATEYWRNLCEAPLGQFTKPNLKRHNPQTTRKNTGTDYHGCLQVRVLRSASLYRKIEGWAAAVMSA